MSFSKQLDLVILSNEKLSKNIWDHHLDDQLLLKELHQEGLHAKILNWRDDLSNSSSHAYLFRSTWGYYTQLSEFKKLLSQLSKTSSMVWNSLDLIRWNLSKKYLFELAKAHVPIIPSKKIMLHPEIFLDQLWDDFESDSLVVKPMIGAGSHLIFKIDSHLSPTENMKNLSGLFHREVIVQRFMPSVLQEGEFSLVFIDGEFSHCIQKRPENLDFRCHEKFGASANLSSCPPAALHQARKILKLLPEESLYARIDFIRNDSHHFSLLELELIEPDLFFRLAPSAAQILAQALSKRL